MTGASAVKARFGGLTERGWGILLPASRRYRIPLGLSDGELLVIDQLLYHYRSPNDWASFSQSQLADELGVGRPTVSEQLKRVRELGLVATKADPRYGRPAPTLFYCLDPYLAALAMLEGVALSVRALWAEGNHRLYQFGIATERGEWDWCLDGLCAPADPAADVLDLFISKYGLSETGPRSVGISAEKFIRDASQTELSVPPTQEESLRISTPVQVEAPIPEELETLVQAQPRTSVLKNVATRLATLVNQRPEDSADSSEQAKPLVAQASDWISKQ